MKSKNFKKLEKNSMYFFIDNGDKKSQNKLLELVDNNKEFIYMKYLDWDTEFFGKSSYILDITKSNFIPNKKMINNFKNNFKNNFITVKLSANYNYKYHAFLQEACFKYIDTEVKLKLKNRKKNISDSKVCVEKLKQNIGLPYEELGSAFGLTRFHTDINIEDKKADKLWIEYLLNFNPGQDKYLYVARLNKKIIGVALVNIVEKEANLFYISVLKEFRNFGAGQALIEKIKNELNIYNITTGTQVKNIKALNFYIQNGFVIENMNSVYHRWN